MNSSCASSIRIGCRSGGSNGRRSPGAASFTRNRCSAVRSTGRRSAEFDQGEQALVDEYGDLEPRRGSPQITPLLRLGGGCTARPAAPAMRQELAEGSLPIASVVWSSGGVELRTTALAYAGQALAGHLVVNRSAETQAGALVLALRPVQINPYWQHGGHASVNALAVEGREFGSTIGSTPRSRANPTPSRSPISTRATSSR